MQPRPSRMAAHDGLSELLNDFTESRNARLVLVIGLLMKIEFCGSCVCRKLREGNFSVEEMKTSVFSGAFVS